MVKITLSSLHGLSGESKIMYDTGGNVRIRKCEILWRLNLPVVQFDWSLSPTIFTR